MCARMIDELFRVSNRTKIGSGLRQCERRRCIATIRKARNCAMFARMRQASDSGRRAQQMLEHYTRRREAASE